MNKDEVILNTIQNLKSIMIISSIPNYESNYGLTMKLTYDWNGQIKSYEIGTTNPLFYRFLWKVIDLYEKEKEERKIIIFGDLTKKIINRKLILNETKIPDHPKQQGLNNFNNDRFFIEKYIPVLKDAINKIYPFYNPNYEMFKIESIDYTYIQNTWRCTYTVGAVKLAFNIKIGIDQSENINFEFSASENKAIIIRGKINTNENQLKVEWEEIFSHLCGRITYDLKNNEKEYIQYNDNDLLYASKEDITSSKEETNMIKNYCSYLGLECNSVPAKIAEDLYMFGSDSIENIDDANYIYSFVRTIIKIKNNDIYIENKKFTTLNSIMVQLEQLQSSNNIFNIHAFKSGLELLLERNYKVFGKDNFSYSLIKCNKPFKVKEGLFNTTSQDLSNQYVTLGQIESDIKKGRIK